MTDGSVLYQQRHDGIVTLTLNRPETLNAMNEAMMGEMERILIELEADAAVRAVILTGAGRAFSSGGDQKRDRSSDGQGEFFDGDLGGALIERLNRCILRMQRLPKPIVGSINGVAAGAGLNIALATDLRIAADTARFGEIFARVGLVPDGGGTYFLPRLVGTAKAMEMILLADIIDAQEALRIGLVNRVVPAEQLENETLKLAERLADGPHGGAQPGDRRPHAGPRGRCRRLPREAPAALHGAPLPRLIASRGTRRIACDGEDHELSARHSIDSRRAGGLLRDIDAKGIVTR